jgi:NADPH2:quinone reductase
MSFHACRVFEAGAGGRVEPRYVSMEVDGLTPGDVVIRAAYSSLNYKDALAVTGRGKILRRFPLNAGIDVAGRVMSSADPRYREGDVVLVNGMGLGEVQDGGLSQVVRVPGDWVVPLPAGLTPHEAMSLGTAGFTAALCVHRFDQVGVTPHSGPVVVTGATGGVGAVAVSILSGLGYRVIAVSGRREHHPWAASLGAAEVRTPEDLDLGSRPLDAARFGGAIDNVGGPLLAGLLRHILPFGAVASVGMAGGHALDITVFPFILRGVCLLGVSSANCPMPLRRELWNRLGADLKPRHLAAIATQTVPLSSAIDECAPLLDRQRVGRTVVDCA